MEIAIKPKILEGQVQVPSSKNLSHYYILAAALGEGKTVLQNISFPQDVLATLSAVQKLGAKIQIRFADREVEIIGVGKKLVNAQREKKILFSQTVVNCQDSGNTLRLCMPIFLLGGGAKFYGSDKLLERNQSLYEKVWQDKEIDWQWETSGISCQGFLSCGVYHIGQQVNIAFLVGLLFALVLVPGKSCIEVDNGIKEEAYLHLALQVLKEFGISVHIVHSKEHISIEIEGGQCYGQGCLPERLLSIEGDYAQAAIFLAANALGNHIEVKGLPNLEQTLQPEKKMIALLEESRKNDDWQVDICEIPYLTPALIVIAALRMGKTIFIYKGSQPEYHSQLLAMCYAIEKMGADVQIKEDCVLIHGVSCLHGAEVDSKGDHRIVMALAMAATVCEEPVMIKNSECIVKSYPDFWQQYVALGGNIECID